ncbi:L-lactate permease [Streptomyces sp. NPDC050636]|uniref:L-lactate permease n=1 Tax=Streptomyces sp. NPDC050636 TaxID=3154510 RepID=UPI003443FF36
MNAALAAVPILVTLGLLAARVKALYAGSAALVAAAVVAFLAFPTAPAVLGHAGAHMLPTMAELAAILFGGILLSELMARTGAQQRLGEWISGACGTPTRALLLIMLGVTPFAESLTGFGIGVVVAIPLLRQLGLAPVKAAIVGLLGLVTVPWGSLAPGSLVAAQLGGVDFQHLGVVSALLSAPVFAICATGALTVTFGLRRALADLLLAVGTLWVTVWAVNVFIGPPLAGVLGALAVIMVLLVTARLREPASAADRAKAQSAGRALAPYGFLVAGLLVSRAALDAVGIEEGWWAVLAGPGGWLLVTCALTPWLLGEETTVLAPALRATVARWWQVALTTAVFVALGTLLTATGMSDALAHAAAALGPAYLLLAPWIGAAGGFLAGSNTGANAMFAASQAGTAHALGYPAVQLVGVQNVSAALASGAAVARIVLAAQLAQDAPGPTPQQPPEAASGGGGVALQEKTEQKADTGAIMRTVLGVHSLVFLVLGCIGLLWR